MYAWIITKDHLAEQYGGDPDEGITGPSAATDSDLARLAKGEGKTFYLYDDDGERYYTGRLVVSGDTEWGSEEQAYAPLGDFGMGWAGCTCVRWHGHPDWECG